MNEKNKRQLYIFATALILIPAAGRLASGIILYLGIVFICLFGILLQYLFKNFASNYAKSIYSIVIIIFLSSIFNQLVKLFSPLMNLYTDFSIYLVSFSVLIIKFVTLENDETIAESLSRKFLQILKYTPLFFLIFILRDYFGYGTITFPGLSKIIEINLPYPKIFGNTFFYGSIPFAVILIAIIMASIERVIKIKNNFSLKSKEKDKK